MSEIQYNLDANPVYYVDDQCPVLDASGLTAISLTDTTQGVSGPEQAPDINPNLGSRRLANLILDDDVDETQKQTAF